MDIKQLMNSIMQETPGKGRDDDVPAMLSEGEYVIPADVVALLGEGNTEAGAKILDNFINSIRGDGEN